LLAACLARAFALARSAAPQRLPQHRKDTILPARPDDTDRLILKLLQEEGRMTNVELAGRLGMSPPPCLRRVRALEEAGFIKGYRALVDEKRLGFEVAFFAFVHLASQAEPDLKAFGDHVRAMPTVRECWTLSGDMDFILKCVAPDMKAFQAFVAEMTALPNVRNVRTALALDQVKDAGAAPV
jgi:DNA-binding Lrp family transcriptional regulator